MSSSTATATASRSSTSFAVVDAGVACSPAQAKKIWSDNFRMPIIPSPGLGAGLDLAGGANGTGIAGYDPSCTSSSACTPAGGPPPAYVYAGPCTGATECASGTCTSGTCAPVVESWAGLTVDQASQLLCDPTAYPSPFGPSSAQGWVGWGEADEVNVSYSLATGQVTDLFFFPGYVGNLVGTCTPGAAVAGALGGCTEATTYTVSMYNDVYMTQQVGSAAPTNLVLSWNTNPNVNQIANELYEALRQTYLPSFAGDVDCVAAGHCVIDNNFTSDGILFFTPFNLAIFFANTVGTTPAETSVPIFLDLGVTKNLPFSDAEVTLKLDPAGVGPVGAASKALLGPGATTACSYTLGTTFATFEADCVEPFAAGSAQNAAAKAALLGGLSHGAQTYDFDLLGFDPQFAANLAPTAVIANGETPGPNDVGYQLDVDQFFLGTIANDFASNDSTKAKDWHGIGELTFLWAYQIHQYMTASYGVNTDLGDPYCVANLTNGTVPLRPGAISGVGPGDGGTGKTCSGLEGIVTTAPTSLIPAGHPTWAVNMLGPSAVTVNGVDPLTGSPAAPCTAAQIKANDVTCQRNGLAIGMKPGSWTSLFCSDAGGLDGNGKPVGYASCIGGFANFNNTYTGAYFDTIQQAVANAYGHYPQATPGPLTIPEELASPGFYFEQWMLALAKYLRTADSPSTSIATMYANPVDPSEAEVQVLNGSFVTGTYVARDTVNAANQPPTELSVSANLGSSVINNFAFTRLGLRGEVGVETALKTVPTDKPGAEPLLLANIAGSPVLQTVYGTYACAVSSSGNGCDAAQVPPVDPLTGASIFEPYADAFGTSVFTLPALNGSANASGISVDSATFASIASANVTLPVYAQPFSVTSSSTPSGTITELVPYAQGAAVGFPVTVAGADSLYVADAIDLSGFALSAQVYFQTGTGNAAVIRGIGASTYLGRVFPCYEKSPTVPGTFDVLDVRMYDNVADVTAWITAHTFNTTNVTADCGIQILSASGTPTSITFGVSPTYAISGTRLDVAAGDGGSFISGVTLFDPAVVSSL